MDKKCSVCGNIYNNRVFRGGFICADCAEYIKKIDLSTIPIQENIRVFKKNKTSEHYR